MTALLIAGRVGSGIGAELANLRASEQIDARPPQSSGKSVWAGASIIFLPPQKQ